MFTTPKGRLSAADVLEPDQPEEKSPTPPELEPELSKLTKRQLRQRATTVGAAPAMVEAAVAGPTPKADLIALILAASPSPSPEPEPEPESQQMQDLRQKLGDFLGGVPIGSPGPEGATSSRGFDATPILQFAAGAELFDASAEQIYAQFVEHKNREGEAALGLEPESAHAQETDAAQADGPAVRGNELARSSPRAKLRAVSTLVATGAAAAAERRQMLTDAGLETNAATPTGGGDGIETSAGEAADGEGADASGVNHEAALRNWHWHKSSWEERAGRVELNEAGGLLSALDSPGSGGPAVPLTGLADAYIDSYVAAQQLHRGLKDVLMVCTRTRNHCAVIYSARQTDGDGFDPQDPLDIFWYDNAPDFVAKRRAKGNLLDRVEMTLFEKAGFGVKLDKARYEQDGIWTCQLAAMPAGIMGKDSLQGRYGFHRPGDWMLVRVEDGTARFVTLLGGRETFAEKIYVHARERKFNPVPEVIYVRVFGIDVETAEPVVRTFQN